jgi:hypothetical protein
VVPTHGAAPIAQVRQRPVLVVPAGSRHLDGGIVGADHRFRHHVLANLFGHRLQRPYRLADPAEQRTHELDAVTGVDLELPVKGQMIAVLCNRQLASRAPIMPTMQRAGTQSQRRCQRLSVKRREMSSDITEA